MARVKWNRTVLPYLVMEINLWIDYRTGVGRCEVNIKKWKLLDDGNTTILPVESKTWTTYMYEYASRMDFVQANWKTIDVT